MAEELDDLVAEYVSETPNAWLVRVVPMGADEPVEVWLPKSRCLRESDHLWRVPTWLLEKHDLV